MQLNTLTPLLAPPANQPIAMNVLAAPLASTSNRLAFLEEAPAAVAAAPAFVEASAAQQVMSRVGTRQMQAMQSQQLLGEVSQLFTARMSAIGSQLGDVWRHLRAKDS